MIDNKIAKKVRVENKPENIRFYREISSEFETRMLRSSLRDYNHAYNYKNRRCDVARKADEKNKEVKSKNCPPFTDWMSKINNTQVDNAKDLVVVVPMYNLIKN